MTAARMQEIVDNMKTKASEHNMFQYGFEMSDDKGRPIGVWYSVLWARTFLRMNEDGTVRIDTPALDIYLRLEQDASAGDSFRTEIVRGARDSHRAPSCPEECLPAIAENG